MTSWHNSVPAIYSHRGHWRRELGMYLSTPNIKLKSKQANKQNIFVKLRLVCTISETKSG